MALQQQFPLFSRILHWTMAVMVLAMLFIGVGMVASLEDYHSLVSIHKPLGILILVLVTIRLINRLINPALPLPAEIAALDRFAINATVVMLYALMFALPIVGWGMLSAAGYPIVLYGPRACRRSCRATRCYTQCCARRIRRLPLYCSRLSSRISAER
jgi:cytochrome b561